MATKAGKASKTWRIHLANQAVQSLAILHTEEKPLLAAWLHRERVAFFDLSTGTPQAEQDIHAPSATSSRDSLAWQTFLTTLRAPNDAFLPTIQLDALTIYLTDDGRMRLYHLGADALILDNDGQEVSMEAAGVTRFVTLSLDRFLGLSAAIDQDGKLHVFQQHIHVGAFDLNLTLTPYIQPHVAMARGGSAIYVSDGQCIVRTDSSGIIHKRLDTYYNIRQMVCSPDGRYVMVNDTDNGVIRVYNGADLAPTHQRFAIDLVAEATQVQLMADLPPTFVAPTTLTCDDSGLVAFSMAGVICVSHISFMDELPRPQPLL